MRCTQCNRGIFFHKTYRIYCHKIPSDHVAEPPQINKPDRRDNFKDDPLWHMPMLPEADNSFIWKIPLLLIICILVVRVIW